LIPDFAKVSLIDWATSGYSESFLAEWKNATLVRLKFNSKLPVDFETKY